MCFTVQRIKRLKLCMVTMVTLPPAKELKIQVVSWQNEIRTLDVLQSSTCFSLQIKIVCMYVVTDLVQDAKTRYDIDDTG